MRRWATVLGVVLACLPLRAEERAPANDSIRAADLRADLFLLASDLYRGRLTGTPDDALAAQLIGARFERLGLEAIGPGNAYYQRYNLMVATPGQGNALEATLGDVTLQARQGQDFYPHRFSGSGEAYGPVTFVGFGIRAPALGYDDYREADVRGRIVLVLDHEPGERDPKSPFDGVVTSESASQLRKTLTAQERGAVGILFVSDLHNHPGEENFEAASRAYWPQPAPRIDRFTLQAWMDRVRIPAAQVSVAFAEALLRGAHRSLGDLAQASETARGTAPVPVPDAQLTLTTAVDRHVVPDLNVVAAIEGADPKLRDEWVLVTAHHDHNGADGALVYPGADDNGSGTVAVMEIAEAYALASREGQRPRRSVLFVVFGAEERGLLGAWAFTEQPLAPLERIVAVLNMDMVGRNEEVPEGGGGRFRGLPVQTAESNANAFNLLGYSRSTTLAAEVERANAAYGLTIKKDYDNNTSNLLRRSDHWPFLQRGVPAVWFHTGLHPDYHTEYDRPEKVNYAKMEKIVRLVHQVSWDLAQQDGRPTLDAPPTVSAVR